MKVKVVREINSAKGIIPIGSIIEISAGLLEKLKGNVEPVTDEVDLWRWFTLEAEKVYRSSPKNTDSWNQHQAHRIAAERFCMNGRIPPARLELKKALEALRGVSLTQQNLI